jgi:heme exporter protein D
MNTTHLGFIIASYALATLLIFGMIAWVIFDYRSQTARLQKFEAQGAARRSGAKLS